MDNGEKVQVVLLVLPVLYVKVNVDLLADLGIAAAQAAALVDIPYPAVNPLAGLQVPVIVAGVAGKGEAVAVPDVLRDRYAGGVVDARRVEDPGVEGDGKEMGVAGLPDVIRISELHDAEPGPVARPLVELIVGDAVLAVLGLVARYLAEKRQGQPLAVKAPERLLDLCRLIVVDMDSDVARVTVHARL